MDSILILIPARGGSKGISRKNIKLFCGKPLIFYSIDVAVKITGDTTICVSTDDEEIKATVEKYGLRVPFLRPSDLATDIATTDEVILHALDFYKREGKTFSKIILLQPTSPFREANDVGEALKLHCYNIDMVVSVQRAKFNPYYLFCTEDKNGFIQRIDNSDLSRRQDAPEVYQFNGAVYIINTLSFEKHRKLSKFERIVKYVMDDLHSVDLDTNMDWAFAEFLVEKKYVAL